MQLKPCPFCGKKATVVEKNYEKTVFVVCCNKGCMVNPSTYSFNTTKEAIEIVGIPLFADLQKMQEKRSEQLKISNL